MKKIESLLGCDRKRKLSKSQKIKLKKLEDERDYRQSEAYNAECMVEELDAEIQKLKYLPREPTRIEKQIFEQLIKPSPWIKRSWSK